MPSNDRDESIASKPLSPLLISYLTFSCVFFIHTIITQPRVPRATGFSIPKVQWSNIPYLHFKKPQPLSHAKEPAVPLDDRIIQEIGRLSDLQAVNIPPADCAKLIHDGTSRDQLPPTCEYAAHQTFNDRGWPEGRTLPPTPHATGRLEPL